MNPHLTLLQSYPFEKLAELKSGVIPPSGLSHIALSIGEPKHPAPAFVLETLTQSLSGLSQYPLTKGLPELRASIAQWATHRFQLQEGALSADRHILPVSGTREALFSFAQACITPLPSAKIVMPNPFYQIYEGAALLAGAQPYFLNCLEENGFIPDFKAVPANIWKDCQLLYICSPGNPTGAVLNKQTLQDLIELADEFDFIIASDECYSELYFDELNPPLGLLDVCAQIGRHDFKRCVVFHSLSKRSNLPGLRSGFVAGDADLLAKFLQYRTYHGCALPVPTQLASIAAWKDEEHVKENRRLYKAKFEKVLNILQPNLPLQLPDASFYFWAKTPFDDTEFTRQLFQEQNVTVLPGQYLARPTENGNPGVNYVRMALVATMDECTEAAERIKHFLEKID